MIKIVTFMTEYGTLHAYVSRQQCNECIIFNFYYNNPLLKLTKHTFHKGI